MALPNIVIIVADQLSFRGVRAYGGSTALPAIESLFDNGTGFSQAYSHCPLCMPARAALWSGSWPHTTGVLSNGRAFAQGEVPETLPTLGRLFSKAGYDCVHFGKEHDAGGLRGFRRISSEADAVSPARGYPINGDTFHDAATRRQAVEFFATRGLETKPDASGSSAASQSLLAVIDFNNPHNICGWVGEMARIRSGDAAPFLPAPSKEPPEGFPPAIAESDLPPLPPNFHDNDFETRPRSVQYQCCAHNRVAQTQDWEENDFRLYLDAYRHYSQLVDHDINAVLTGARQALPDENTFYVFLADHGDAMAAHGAVTKHTTFYEETTRVPFVFVGPGIAESRMISGPVSLLDLFPTLCELAGVDAGADVLSQLAGESLASSLLAPDRSDSVPDVPSSERRYVLSEWHTEWGYTIEPGRMITDGRWKYMTYAERSDEEFYDLESDPYETKNLTPLVDSNATVREELSRLRTALKEHVVAAADPFFTLTHTVHERWRTHAPGYRHHRGITAAQAE